MFASSDGGVRQIGLAGVCLAVLTTALTPPLAARAQTRLGSYEQQALTTALARTGLEVDDAPAGKVLREVHVVNLDVFSQRDGFLQWFNVFHRTTRDRVVAREVLLEPGQLWNQALVDETARKLRDPIFTTLVVVVPVIAVGGRPDQVDLLVVTRDVWSLRLNSNFEIQADQLTYLLIAPSENNFLGLRKLASLVFEMRQGDYSVGPMYLDKNVLGNKLQLFGRGQAYFNRQTSEYEGESVELSLERTFWSLASRWGGGVSVFHEDRISRSFIGLDLRRYTPPGLACGRQSAPFEHRRRVGQIASVVSHQLGERYKHRFTIGHRLTAVRPSFLDDFPGGPCLRDHYVRDVFPRDERTSSLFARYQLFDTVFGKLRNIDTFDLAEDIRFGPLVTLELFTAVSVIGSESTFTGGELSASWTVPWGQGGFLSLASGVEGRWRADEPDDDRASGFVDRGLLGRVSLASPMLGDRVRVLGRLSFELLDRDTQNVFYTLGGENGLRGYPPNFFAGDIRVIGNLELRSAPVRLGFTRLGGLVFFDAGDSADDLGDLGFRGDVGLGFRMLIPQLSTLVYRLDWAIPLEGPTAGFPGRISAGAGQAF